MMDLDETAPVLDRAQEFMLEILTGDLELSPVTVFSDSPNITFGIAKHFKEYVKKSSTVKATVVSIATSLWEHAAEMYDLAQVQRTEIETLRRKLIENQETVISLQKRVIEERSETVTEFKSAVETCVAASVGSSFKTYSEIAAPSVTVAPAITTPVISPNELKQAMKVAAEEEERSRNIVVFGLPETTGKKLDESVSDILEQLELKPRVTGSFRVGVRKEGATRPVIVSFGSSSAASQVIYHARGLRDNSDFEGVYIGPDRSWDQRVIRRKLVEELKKRRSDEPERKHFIKDGRVQTEAVK